MVLIFLLSRMSEIAIQGTAVDAVACKVYAIKQGYYQDEAMLKLVSPPSDRKSPEIARGTWARVQATREAVRKFLVKETSRNKIVVNCGAGFDTGFWWAENEKILGDSGRWIDLDMEAVVRKKIRSLRMPQ